MKYRDKVRLKEDMEVFDRDGNVTDLTPQDSLTFLFVYSRKPLQYCLKVDKLFGTEASGILVYPNEIEKI
jgi:hypothetical protein